MAASKNYYQEIDVSQNASTEEIINAVKQLVKANQPDNFSDTKERENVQQHLRLIKRAYETLKDENLRLEYDLSLVNDSQPKSSNTQSKTRSFKFISSLILGTVAVTAGATVYLSNLDCSNQRNVVDATICEKTKPIREIFGSTETAAPVVVTAESAHQTPSEKPVETASAPAATKEPTPVSKEPDVKNTEPVNVQVNVTADNSVNNRIPVAQTAPVQEIVTTPSTVNSSNECYDLWYQRNLAYAQKGYCFESNLGKRVFSGFNCSQTPAPLSSEEKSKINQIKQKESSLNCRLNTDSTEVPSSAPIASQTQIQPAATLQPAQPVVQQPINTGSAPAIQTVIVEGVGTTPQDAAQNAAQNALTNVVGTFIDANTMLQKRTLITDGIKSETKNISKDIKDYSQGSIKSFEILETKQESGLFRVNAKVTVRNENFSAYIKKIAQGEVTVGNDLYAKMATENKQKDNLTAILKDNVILPILSGEVQDIEAEKPIPLSEAIREHKFPAWLVEKRIGYDSLIFKVNTGLKKDFLTNLNQTLLNTSSSHKNFDISEFFETLGKYRATSGHVKDGFVLLKEIAKNPNIIEFFDFQGLGGLDINSFGFNQVKLKIILSDNSNSPLHIYSSNNEAENNLKIYSQRDQKPRNLFTDEKPWNLFNLNYRAYSAYSIIEKTSFYVVLNVDAEIMKQMDKITVTLDK
ncbi:MAG: YARHG domain-containing protein [Methylococcaceae bacterium]